MFCMGFWVDIQAVKGSVLRASDLRQSLYFCFADLVPAREGGDLAGAYAYDTNIKCCTGWTFERSEPSLAT